LFTSSGRGEAGKIRDRRGNGREWGEKWGEHGSAINGNARKPQNATDLGFGDVP